jgi:PAS domain S-box-containing protein
LQLVDKGLKVIGSWSLLSKTTLLIFIPVVLQIGMLFLMIRLHQQAESQLGTIVRSQRVISLLNDTNKDVYELLYFMSIKKFQFDDMAHFAELKTIAKKTDQHLDQLSQCAPEDLEIQENVNAARKLKYTASELLASLVKSYSDPVSGQQTREYVKERCNALLFDATLNLLPKIAEKQASLVKLVPIKSAELRSEQERIILVAAIVELFLSIAVAYLLTKSVVARISRLNDNTYRLAAHLPLNPPDQGTDEIAHLDRTIQRLARELSTIARRESLLVENASDVIMTLDRSAKITNVNQASAGKLGYHSRDLIGMRLADLANPSSRARVVKHLSGLKETGEGEVLETQLGKIDGTVIEVFISTSWFAPESCFFCIIHDVTAQKNAQRLKNDMVAMASHDLKTPLSTVDYLLSTFEQNEQVNRAVRDDLEMARRNIKRMAQLIADFLDSEKIESNMYALKRETLKVADIFQKTQEACNGLADKRSVSLDFQPSDLLISGDSEAVIRVLTNLVTNAVNHSNPQGVVRVNAELLKDHVEFKVSDHGEGLSPETAAKIFERFYQAPSKKTVDSSGLGLTICKLLVELGNGTIGVDSTPSAGSTFHFTVPAEHKIQS